jgi:hypothetical protein
MNLTAEILAKVRNSKKFPMFITSKEYPLIQESAYIIQALEGDGYKVDTYVDTDKEIYGIRVDE